MAHTENSGEGGVPSNSQSTYTTPNSLSPGDIIESNKAMFSALTKVLQKTITSMGTQLYEHSKYHLEQVSKLTEAVTQMTSLHNANKLASKSTADPENSNNSDSGEDNEENDRWSRVTIHGMDRSLYNENDFAASFLSHQETSSSSGATTGKSEDDPTMGSVFKEFSESYNQANENWGEPASEEVTKVASVIFKETLSETALKNLLTKVILPENCKFAQAKLVNPVVFVSVSPSMRSTDIKLQEVQCNISKMTGCFIKLLSLPNILKTNGDHRDEKLEEIQTILDGIKMSGHTTQNLVSIRKKFILSGVSSEYKIWLSLLRTLTLIFLRRN